MKTKTQIKHLKKGDLIDLGGHRGVCAFDCAFSGSLWDLEAPVIVQATNPDTKSTHNYVGAWEDELVHVLDDEEEHAAA
jgi:hypothetical protein